LRSAQIRALAAFIPARAQDLEQVREVVHGNPYGMC
jgi:hypothetical protein